MLVWSLSRTVHEPVRALEFIEGFGALDEGFGALDDGFRVRWVVSLIRCSFPNSCHDFVMYSRR